MDPHKPLWEGEHCASFVLNGHIHKVSSVPGDTSLNTYIRQYARLKGTKFMCKEGGCGICVVSLQFRHPTTGQERTVSVNSCMFPLYACHGCKVTTIEGIGNRTSGYHPIQSRLAQFYGTQCGYCSPGWVMSMFSLLESNPNATMKKIENSFSGNLCRCTGYRPIMDAFKSFASDRSKDLEQTVTDIEDLMKICPRANTTRHNVCNKNNQKIAQYSSIKGKVEEEECATDFLEVALPLPSIKLKLKDERHWYKVETVDEIYEIFGMISGTYRLVGGNTAIGIIKDQPAPDVYIDINSVGFLKAHTVQSNHLYIGACTTLADTIVLLNAVAQENPAYFLYTKEIAKHIEKVANNHVRNVGTLAGNLSIKHQQREFPSDIFLLLQTVGAVLSIRSENESITLMPLTQYLETDMYKKVILQVILPPLDCNTTIVKTFKIAPRAQNAVAYVNGGFRFRVDKEDHFRVLEPPTIMFGGISPYFTHAYHTETFYNGRQLLHLENLQTALSILGKEVNPDYKLPDAKPEYRRGLAQALLYRVVLSLHPEAVSARYRSGGEDITRPLSSGKQQFDTDSSRPPLYHPSPKLDSILLTSGEAEYVYDLPEIGNDLYAAIVITKQGPTELRGLDPSKALKIPGVVAFYSANDIPGENTFTPINEFMPDKEELFASKQILYAGQAVGVIVADTQELADIAAECVTIIYGDKKKPVLNVQEVLKNKDDSRIFLRQEKKSTTPKGNVKKVVKGEFQTGSQYHFTMETLSCVTVPKEDELDVYCSTQWIQVVQETVALVLNIPENRINMNITRVGGGYGQKLTRSSIVGGACSLAAYFLQRPVRLIMKLETVMEAIGKRGPAYFNYETGVSDEGEIQYLQSNFYEDVGSSFNDITIDFAFPAFGNVYDSSTWATKMYDVKTDKSSSVWTRGPGTLESVAMAEHIIEHIAHELNLDPLTVRMKNLERTYPVENMLSSVQEMSDYEARKTFVEKFNKENVWKKRGISVLPMRFPMDTLANYHAMISVFRGDGSVAIVHGGVEIGQGINTKAAQVCASALGIPLHYVTVKPTNNLICPDTGLTGGSFTSESVCFAVEQCCIELNRRLEPVQKNLESTTWEDIIKQANADKINLNVAYMYSPKTDLKSYQIFGAIVMEAEVDILTGEHKVIRVDILEDAGKSLNQFVDIGQIEGAFIMGLGYFTSEEQIHDPDTGRVLTNRTLKYKIPGVKDIPIDFRTYILKNGDNPLGILRSKSVGEPPICLSISILFAIRQALRSARKDLDLSDNWLDMDAPFTAEKIFLSSGINEKKYTI